MPTQSLVMRSRSGTVRIVDATHRIDKMNVSARRELATFRPDEDQRAACRRRGGMPPATPSLASVLEVGTVVEGELGDEQRHGEADPGDAPDTGDVAPPGALGQSGRVRAGRPAS